MMLLKMIYITFVIYIQHIFFLLKKIKLFNKNFNFIYNQCFNDLKKKENKNTRYRIPIIRKEEESILRLKS